MTHRIELIEGQPQAMLPHIAALAGQIGGLQAGFEVCGTLLERRKILKLILQRHLD